MKKIYTSPTLRIIRLKQADLIATSTGQMDMYIQTTNVEEMDEVW